MQYVIAMTTVIFSNSDSISFKQFIEIYKREAVPQLLNIVERIKSICVDATDVSYRYSKKGNGHQPIHGNSAKITTFLLRNGANFVFSTTRYENGSDDRIESVNVIGSNSKYSFSVVKNVLNNKYYIKEYGIPMSEDEIRKSVGYYGYIYALEELQLEKYFQKDGDVLDKIIKNNDEYVLHYRVKDVRKYGGKRSYVVSYRPSLMWQKSYETYNDNGFNTNILYSYINNNGTLLVSKIRYEYDPLLESEKGTYSTLEFIFNYHDNCMMHDYEFTLSAFGLPEPFGITWERPRPWWVYFGLAGVGCLVGIVLIGVFLRRRYGAS